jgi:ABC-type bacteriocin/lantibiotic exporter with double-glycine peptidase domain
MPGFPFFKQLDSMDCGPSCLRMVAKFFGKNYTLQALRSKAFISKSGVLSTGEQVKINKKDKSTLFDYPILHFIYPDQKSLGNDI